MIGSTAHRAVEGLHAAPDPALRPGRLPDPWSRLEWRPLAPVRNRSKARLFWAADGGRRLVCKDGSGVSPLRPMGLYRRLALRREAVALSRLAGVPGVPGLLGRWPSGLVMEFVPGRMLTTWPRGGVPAAVFDRLDGLVAAIHARGVAIGDLHRRNILVSDDGAVHLVDFELSFDTGRGLGRLVGRWLMSLDRHACLRQRQRFGVALDAEQAARLARLPAGYALLQRVKFAARSAFGRVKHRRRSAARGEDSP
ncbi:MAG TPA: hypothetical protein VFD43_05175 [Planctomycetota bacterium]|nr:hypothetical protein [Planctomycetota bacterium]